MEFDHGMSATIHEGDVSEGHTRKSQLPQSLESSSNDLLTALVLATR